jgi:hypothetical protein
MKPSDELRSSREFELRGHERLPSHLFRGRFPEVDIGAGLSKTICEIALERGFIARRIAGKPSGRVEAHQLGGESDEIGAPLLDLLTDASFLCGQ